VGVPLPARASQDGPLTLSNDRGEVVLDLHGGVDGGRATTAYVWRCDTGGGQRLALRLLQEGFKVAASTRSLRAAGRDYPRGSFVARIERNPDTLHERIAGLARVSGVRVQAARSAWTETGDTGVGSEAIVSLKEPRIAVLVDEPTSPTSYGALWFLLERRLGLRFTALRVNAVGDADLARYNIVLVPGGNPGALAGAMGDGGISRLKDWVSRGGTLVCLEDAAEFPTLKNVDLSSARAVGVKPPSDKKDDDEEKDAKADSIARENERRPEYVPGTVFWATLDPLHFLNYGYGTTRVPVMLQGRLFLKPSRDGANPATFDRGPLKLSGWSWPETERRLQGTAYAVDEKNGGGHVIMIVGLPGFRLFWRGSERMLLNALLYAPALD
jgi:hypothetical protein